MLSTAFCWCLAVVLFNFRADRMVEISKAFEYPDFDIFDRERYPKVGQGDWRGCEGRQWRMSPVVGRGPVCSVCTLPVG